VSFLPPPPIFFCSCEWGNVEGGGEVSRHGRGEMDRDFLQKHRSVPGKRRRRREEAVKRKEGGGMRKRKEEGGKKEDGRRKNNLT